MKTLSSDTKIELLLDKSKLDSSRELKSENQVLYDYLNKLKFEKDQILLSLILPVYNEEQTIRSILENLPKDNSIEIIVIDDHSTDKSIEEIEKIRNQGNIKLIKHKRNCGYGAAIIAGLNHAQGDVIVTMDSDGQHSPKDILNLIKPIFEGKVDCTIGSRYLGANHYDLPIRTRLGEAIIEKLTQLFFGPKIMNNQNGFRAFSNNLIPILKKAQFKGFAYATEMILLISIYGCKFMECPIRVYQREYGASKIKFYKLIIDLYRCFFQCYLKKIKLILFNNERNMIK